METEQQQKSKQKKVKWPSKNYITFELWNSWKSNGEVDQYYTWMMFFALTWEQNQFLNCKIKSELKKTLMNFSLR